MKHECKTNSRSFMLRCCLTSLKSVGPEFRHRKSGKVQKILSVGSSERLGQNQCFIRKWLLFGCCVRWEWAERIHPGAGVATAALLMARPWELPSGPFHPAILWAFGLRYGCSWYCRSGLWGCLFRRAWARGRELEGLERNVRGVTRFVATRVSVVGRKITHGDS